ncbi:type II toxin-antitoxin system PemK/MazF family toxin [Mangrovicella endophytica]|uniref:type II toxin-antitoxin system PemK/MazF family toxin n=1 Tax=Mangrovicella endophytica TaxID=2066697 RepID=UPI000C9E88AF|nr:type II toxin-antitoxin system PemK/MazF family toxin [Mangrovicella endophytica]
MNDRPILSLKPKLAEAGAERVAAAVSELQTAPRTGTAQYQAGSIGSLLNVDGCYDEFGSFAVREGQKLAIREPRIMDVFWCRFTDAVYPEFGKLRPVLVVSRKNRLGTHSLVLPITTAAENAGRTAAVKLSKNPNPNSDDDSWVIADHLYAVSHWRLQRFKDNVTKELRTPKISQADLDRVLDRLWAALPKRRPLDAGNAPS